MQNLRRPRRKERMSGLLRPAHVSVLFLFLAVEQIAVCLVIPAATGYTATAAVDTRFDDFYGGSGVDDFYAQPEEGSIPSPELNALYSLYNATNGTGWKWENVILNGPVWDFTSINPLPCQPDNAWQGLACECASATNNSLGLCYLYNVTNIILEDFGLRGFIPEAIGDLLALTDLNLATNDLSGTIPVSIGNMPQLEGLQLFSNSLSGTLPTTFQNLYKMLQLQLNDNKLEGNLTDDLVKNWKSMQYIDLSYNSFTGPLPSSLVNDLPALRIIYLNTNLFSGSLPFFSTGSNGTNNTILNLDFSDNSFSGNITSVMESMPFLTSFAVDDNEMTGSIPSVFPQFLTELSLSGNQVSSSLPVTIDNAPHLRQLYLFDNIMSGYLPATLGSLQQLTRFDSYNNIFSGTIPEEIGSLGSLRTVYLNNNALSGVIPSSMGDLSELHVLYLFNNKLSGTLPLSLGKLEKLIFVQLNLNDLSGSLPDNFFANWTEINELYLYSNRLSGSLPRSIATMTQIVVLQLQNNGFTGTLNDVFNFSNQPFLETIQLSSNQFQGVIPADIFKLPRLRIFACVSNCLKGPLPTSAICNSSTIETLLLDGLHTASSCRKPVLWGMLRKPAYTLTYHFEDGLDECFFRIPSLLLLHMSGNGLQQQLQVPPQMIEDGRSIKMSQLILSHNLFSGTIPLAIQETPWVNLDLSFNKFTGTLTSKFSEGFEISGTNIRLLVNRISGKIPDALRLAQNIKILNGNLFSCNWDGSSLPENDSERSHYSCGSKSFDGAYTTWILLASTTLSALLITRVLMHKRLDGNEERYHMIWLRHIYMNVKNWLSASSSGMPTATFSKPVVVIGSLPYRIDTALKSATEKLQTETDELLWMTLLCGSYILLVLMPVYVICGVFYSTYTHQYAWVVSVNYLSGVVPAVVLMVVLMIFMCLFWYAYLVKVSLADQNKRKIDQYSKSLISASSGEGMVDDEWQTIHNGTRRAQNDSGWKHCCTELLAWVATAIANAVCVISVNIAFVYVATQYGNDRNLATSQIALAMFKYIWNSFGFRKILLVIMGTVTDIHDSKMMQRIVFAQMIATLFNNIVVPCFVVTFIDANCFYNLLHPPSTVVAKYRYNSCVYDEIANGFNSCSKTQEIIGTTKFKPPFIYSYQCTSSFTTYYASAFTFFCVLSSFVVPMINWMQVHLHMRARRRYELKKINSTSWEVRILDLITPAVLQVKPIVSASIEAAGMQNNPLTIHNLVVDRLEMRPNKHRKVYFDSSRYLCMLTTLIALLLTFGAVFPPLAVALALTIPVYIYKSKLYIGRFICIAREEDLFLQLENITTDVALMHLPPMRLTWALVGTACCFYAVVLFDVIGDKVGIHAAWWILPVMGIVFPSALIVAYSLLFSILTTHPRPDCDANPPPRRSMLSFWRNFWSAASDKSLSSSSSSSSKPESSSVSHRVSEVEIQGYVS